MTETLRIEVDGWIHGKAIPARFAFGKPGGEAGPFAASQNISPAIRWTGAPEGTKSFAIVVVDNDAPSSGEDVNQAGKTVPADLARVPFYHWLLVDIPAACGGLAEAAASRELTPRGKPVGERAHGLAGANDYTSWFEGDADMEGVYGGYDGPCPPWNDSIVHHYHLEVYALSVASLGLSGPFRGPDVLGAIAGKVLARGSFVGTYSMNPDVTA